MPGNYRYEEERHRGQRGMTQRGGFGERGRDEEEFQEQQTERFGSGPDYNRERERGARNWGGGRGQYGYDEGFTRGAGQGRSLGSRESFDDDESGSYGRQGSSFRDNRYEGGSGRGGNYSSYGNSGFGGSGNYEAASRENYEEYRNAGGYGVSGARNSSYGNPNRGRDWESNRGGGSMQADGWTGEPDEMRFGRQQGLYGSSEYGGYISSQRAQTDFQSHVGKGPKGWQRSDERIREEACEALARHPGIDASDIEVRVQNCEIVLSGSVTDRRAKREAEEVAERVFGAKDVQNQIRVKPDGQDGFSRDRSGERELSRSTERDTRASTEQQLGQRTTSGTGATGASTTR